MPKRLRLQEVPLLKNHLADDLCNNAVVSRLWHRITIHTAQVSGRNHVENVRIFFDKNLGESYSEQKEKLFVDVNEIQVSKNLIEIKASIHRLKLEENFANILKEVKNEDIDKLKLLKQDEDKLFNNIFDLISIFKKIDEAHKIQDQGTKNSTLQSIAEEVAMQGRINHALEIARDMPDEHEQSGILASIVDVLLKQGDMGKATKIAKEIPDRLFQNDALRETVKAFLNLGEIERAIEMFKMISHTVVKKRTAEYIVSALMGQNKIEEVLKFANSMSDERLKSKILETVKRFSISLRIGS